MFSYVLAPYLTPTRFFSVFVPRRISIRNIFIAALILGTVPLVRIGLGNLLGMLSPAYFDEYAVIYAFSLWQKPYVIMQQQLFMVPAYMLGIFFYSAMVHVLLIAAQGAKATFPATLRCLCFAVPCMYLAALPFSGAITSVIYCSIFLAYSLKATHDVRWSRVLPVIALNIPILLIVCRILFS